MQILRLGVEKIWRCLWNRRIGVIGAAHQRSGFDMSEPDLAAGAFVLIEFLLRDVANDRQMLLRGPQILPQGQDVNAMLAQVSHDLQHF